MSAPHRKRSRRFIDAPQGARCAYDITLKDGSGAQCGRARTEGDYCTQHARIVGIAAIIALQAVAGITETPEEAAEGWDAMKDWERQSTMDAYKAIFPHGAPS